MIELKNHCINFNKLRISNVSSQKVRGNIGAWGSLFIDRNKNSSDVVERPRGPEYGLSAGRQGYRLCWDCLMGLLS